MTPDDVMMWSIAVVVFLGCLLISILLIRGIFTAFGRDEEEMEDSDENDSHKGFRRIK